jgi:hypothetical protein
MVDNLNCDYFQRTKLDGKGYGFLPACEVQSIPFEECTSDLIGPWKIQEKIFKLYYRSVTSEMCALQQQKNQDMASAKDEYYLISINHAVFENIVYIHIATPKNTSMKLHPLLCMP